MYWTLPVYFPLCYNPDFASSVHFFFFFTNITSFDNVLYIFHFLHLHFTRNFQYFKYGNLTLYICI